MASARAQRQLKRGLKKIHPATKAIAILFLVIGIAAGALFSLYTFQNDRFLLKGESSFSIDVGETYTYTEQGVDAVCFGRDVSDRLTVQTDLQKDANGNYIIPTDKAGVYTITYTVDCLKFGEKSPNGVIKRIRVFTVNEVEEDGRNGE